MESSIATTAKQLVGRLEDATSSERIDALLELQTLAKTDGRVVGELTLQRVLDFLREQGSTEEYQESLDLIYKLVKNVRDPTTSKKNSSIILANISNVELLLDLLEHEDLTVGVMTSQILTEVHTNEGRDLEKQIQDCPAGMFAALDVIVIITTTFRNDQAASIVAK